MKPEAEKPTHAESRELYSVAQIQHVMRVEFGRAQRYRYPLVCAMVSIDTLGAVRDAHGYDAKEAVFHAVVKLLENATRGSDFIGRTADDRLLAVLPHTDGKGLRLMSERLLKEARALKLEGELRRTQVTLSIGAVSNEHEGLVYHDAMYSATENALSDAIAAGGGRLVEGRP
ncbi:MAG: diguanylate cyclase [Planctomycetes bacterium]|nr:diguanylate cyclase [Planctomycetota bacterium]